MADPILALIGGLTLIVLGIGAIISLIICSTQFFLALFQKKKTNCREKHLLVLDDLHMKLFTAPQGNYPDKTSPLHMMDMIALMRQNPMPDDKMARWTGFIQGVMAANGWLSVDAERDRTRPIFNGE